MRWVTNTHSLIIPCIYMFCCCRFDPSSLKASDFMDVPGWWLFIMNLHDIIGPLGRILLMFKPLLRPLVWLLWMWNCRNVQFKVVVMWYSCMVTNLWHDWWCSPSSFQHQDSRFTTDGPCGVSSVLAEGPELLLQVFWLSICCVCCVAWGVHLSCSRNSLFLEF